jgi:hypothetical protein
MLGSLVLFLLSLGIAYYIFLLDLQTKTKKEPSSDGI